MNVALTMTISWHSMPKLARVEKSNNGQEESVNYENKTLRWDYKDVLGPKNDSNIPESDMLEMEITIDIT